MKEITINYKGIELLVEGTYIPGEEEVRYFSDMSGQPSSSSEFDINAVYVNDVDIFELLSEDSLIEIETLILEDICG